MASTLWYITTAKEEIKSGSLFDIDVEAMSFQMRGDLMS